MAYNLETSSAGVKPLVPLAGYMPALDGVRGFAILWVMLLHFYGRTVVTTGFDEVVRRLAVTGLYGIDLFFVLSGFLITGILLDSKAKPAYFKNFFMRRCLRIVPLYYGVLAVIFLVMPLIPWFQGPDLATLESHQAWAWTYTVNFFIARTGEWTSLPYISHFWSLAVEEHFYFVWPFVVYFASRKTLLRVCIVLAAFSLLLRWGIQLSETPRGLADYVLTPCHLDTLCLGAFLAALIRRDNDKQQWLPKLKKLALLLVPCSIAWVVVSEVFRHLGMPVVADFPRQIAYLLAILGFFVFALTAAPGSLLNRALTSSASKGLGKYSYGLYIFHNPIALYFAKIGMAAWLMTYVGNHTLAILLAGALGMSLSFLMAMASFHFFEKHFLKLKVLFGEKKAV